MALPLSIYIEFNKRSDGYFISELLSVVDQPEGGAVGGGWCGGRRGGGQFSLYYHPCVTAGHMLLSIGGLPANLTENILGQPTIHTICQYPA